MDQISGVELLSSTYIILVFFVSLMFLTETYKDKFESFIFSLFWPLIAIDLILSACFSFIYLCYYNTIIYYYRYRKFLFEEDDEPYRMNDYFLLYNKRIKWYNKALFKIDIISKLDLYIKHKLLPNDLSVQLISSNQEIRKLAEQKLKRKVK